MTDYALSKLFYDLHNDPKLGGGVPRRHDRVSSTATASRRRCAQR